MALAVKVGAKGLSDNNFRAADRAAEFVKHGLKLGENAADRGARPVRGHGFAARIISGLTAVYAFLKSMAP